LVALLIGGYEARATNQPKNVGSTDFILFLNKLPSRRYHKVKNKTSKNNIALNAI